MTDKLPNHVGIIMDGNRRWAKSQGLKAFDGHFSGYKNIREIAKHMFSKAGVGYLSAFVFSTENWNRTEEEVGYLMKLVLRALTEYLDEFDEDDIRIVILGSRERLSKQVIEAINKAERQTKDNQAGTLALCFNYGGHQEIADAAKRLAKTLPDGQEVTPELFSQYLYHPEVPPIDLLIRTSGEYRLSGYMLWRAAYAELYFTKKHWPEFTISDADDALAEFASRQRRFGA